MTLKKENWKSEWPTTLDWNFNFYKLLDSKNPIGKLDNEHFKVAIVGAGVAGLFAARELIKAGCTNVDIYEASERLGGRTYSIKAIGQKTTYEMGAMRFPFFDKPGSKNCVLDYLREKFVLEVKDFPMPGGEKCWTAAYLNDGLGISGNADNPNFLSWTKKEDKFDSYLNSLDKNQRKDLIKLGYNELRRIDKAWETFAKTFKTFLKHKYETLPIDDWKKYWGKIVKFYHDKDFRQLVFEENVTLIYDKDNLNGKNKKGKLISELFEEGNFGGLGFKNDRATTFFTIGAGDGGWGAFYDISSLYVIRILLGGYGSNHQLIVGSNINELKRLRDTSFAQFNDTIGNKIETPNFLGVQSIAECLFYSGIKEICDTDDSIYNKSIDSKSKINFYINEPVEELSKSLNETTIKLTSKNFSKSYNAVILTTPTWATQVNLDIKFHKDQLPHNVIQSMKFSHWINSCKLFFPLKERFWNKGNFPQVILTDTFIQDIYIYSADDDDPGILLASYTWEDNSMKMLGFKDDKEMADACLRKLDEIFTVSKVLNPTTNQPLMISKMVNMENPIVIHWSKKPTYAGCSKLYRQNNEVENYRLLNYNRNCSNQSNLYFAGEAYSVEGGWLEPATRLAVDAVIHLIKNNGKLLELDYGCYKKLTNTEYLNELDINK